MDFTKVINQAIARSVNKCYAEEEAIRLPQTNWAFTPLIPPGCVPFLELYGLENVVDKVLNKIKNGSSWEDVSSDDSESDEVKDEDTEFPQCLLCLKDFAPSWIKIQNGVVCSTCAKKKTGVGFISENRERIGKVLEKVSSGIKTIEISASERLSQIGEMRNRKRKFHETQFNFDKNKVAMPPLLRELFENTLSAHKKRKMLEKAAEQRLAQLRNSRIVSKNLPPLNAPINDMDDLLKFCE